MISQELIDTCISLRGSGKNVSEIAKLLNVSKPYVYKIFGQSDIDLGAERRWTNELKSQVTKMRLSGMTYSEISDNVGKPLESVKSFCKKSGIKIKRNEPKNKLHEIEVKKRVYENSKRKWVYVDGYKTMDSVIRIKCVECGRIDSINAHAIMCKNVNHICADCKKSKTDSELAARKYADKKQKFLNNCVKAVRIMMDNEERKIKECKMCKCLFHSSSNRSLCDKCKVIKKNRGK